MKVVWLVLFCLSSGLAFAQGKPAGLAGFVTPTTAPKPSVSSLEAAYPASHPCHNDVKTFCRQDGYAPAENNGYMCFTKNFNSLSAACQKFVDEKMRHFPCWSDTMKFCVGAHRNYPESASCLQFQSDSLSKECRHVFDLVARQQQVCKAEIMKLCPTPGVKHPYLDKHARECVMNARKSGKLSSACVEAMNQVKASGAYGT